MKPIARSSPAWCTCPAGHGWTYDIQLRRWVCPNCRKESKLVYEARAERDKEARKARGRNKKTTASDLRKRR